MCSVLGYIVRNPVGRRHLLSLMTQSEERGRDSWGLQFQNQHSQYRRQGLKGEPFPALSQFPTGSMFGVGNMRGEPTTEWVQTKSAADVQPFVSPSGNWVFTHNGTIANDKEIVTRYGEGELPTTIDSYAIGVALDAARNFQDAIESLQGSFAIIAYHVDEPDHLYWATNYKPLYACYVDGNIFLASQVEYFNPMLGVSRNHLGVPGPVRLGPYEMGRIDAKGVIYGRRSLKPFLQPKSLVVCSGGLDSGTVAWLYAMHYQNPTTLLHIEYGAKAQGAEIRAVEALAEHTGAELQVIRTDFFTSHAQSVLTDMTLEVNKSRGGEAGAEFAHEWVPARNTVMLALAVAIAERDGFGHIAIGSNMEEGGAYPDNEMEFINRWNDLIPFAVKAYANVQIDDPFGHYVKHEIVERGASIGMPFELTWSCYEGEKVDTDAHGGWELIHCGSCGPCAMRMKAFEMAGVTDPTRYAIRVP